MDSDTNDDHPGGRPDSRSEAARRRSQLRLVLVLAIAVFAVSLAFVLVYAAGLTWLPALLISVVLGAGQVYTLRRSLFRRAGDDDTGDATGDDTGDDTTA